MAKIHFVDHTGEKRTIEVENGATVMEAAIRNAIPGIEAECGGACACATCHVYVDEAWREKVGAPTPMEEDMLDFGFDVRPNSRLSCQIKVSDELDGLTVSTPERQCSAKSGRDNHRPGGLAEAAALFLDAMPCKSGQVSAIRARNMRFTGTTSASWPPTSSPKCMTSRPGQRNFAASLPKGGSRASASCCSSRKPI